MEKKSYQITDGGWDKAATPWVELKSHSAHGFSVHAKQMHSMMLHSPFYIMSCLGRHKAYLRPNILCVFCLCLKFVTMQPWGGGVRGIPFELFMSSFFFRSWWRTSHKAIEEEWKSRSFLPASVRDTWGNKQSCFYRDTHKHRPAHTHLLCVGVVYLSYTTFFSRKLQVINLLSHIL